MNLKKWNERTAPPNVKPEPSQSRKLDNRDWGLPDAEGYQRISINISDKPEPLRGKDPIQEEVKRLQDNLKLSDMVNHPSHYNAYPMENLETIKGSMSEIEYRGFLKGTIEKYLYRYDLKGKPAEDLKKARFYLDELIKSLEEE